MHGRRTKKLSCYVGIKFGSISYVIYTFLRQSSKLTNIFVLIASTSDFPADAIPVLEKGVPGDTSNYCPVSVKCVPWTWTLDGDFIICVMYEVIYNKSFRIPRKLRVSNNDLC